MSAFEEALKRRSAPQRPSPGPLPVAADGSAFSEALRRFDRDASPRIRPAGAAAASVAVTSEAPTDFTAVGQSLARSAPEDPESIPLVSRFIAQLTADDEARLRVLEKEYGKGNVGHDPASDTVFIRTGGEIRVLDKPFRAPWTLDDIVEVGRDVTDLAGEAVEALSGAAGGVLGTFATPGVGTVAGEAAGSAAGRAAVEQLQESVTGVERDIGKQALVAAALGGLGSTVGEVASGVSRALKPSHALAEAAIRSEPVEGVVTEVGERGLGQLHEIGKQTGIELTPGQAFDSESLAFIEGVVSRMPSGDRILRRAEKQRLIAWRRNVAELSESLGSRASQKTPGTSKGNKRIAKAIRSSLK